MKVEDLIVNDRVCLKPMKWNELYDAMVKVYPEQKKPFPLILSAWHYTNDMKKSVLYAFRIFNLSRSCRRYFAKNK